MEVLLRWSFETATGMPPLQPWQFAGTMPQNGMPCRPCAHLPRSGILVNEKMKPRHQSATRDRCRGHHGVELDTTFNAVATTATKWIPLLMPWPPRRRNGYRFRCRGFPGVELQLGIAAGPTTTFICDARWARRRWTLCACPLGRFCL